MEISRVYAVGFWKWKVPEDTCSICTEKLEFTCPKCISPGEACPPACGTCGHSFHLHCIQQWLSQPQHQEHGGPLNSSCPMCRQPYTVSDNADDAISPQFVNFF